MKPDTTESQIKYIEEQTATFSSGQDVFNGQYKMIDVSSNNQYDVSYDLSSSSNPIKSFTVTFTADTQINPFVFVSPIIYADSPTTLANPELTYILGSRRVKTGSSGKIIKYKVDTISLQNIIYIKFLITASDTGTFTAS